MDYTPAWKERLFAFRSLFRRHLDERGGVEADDLSWTADRLAGEVDSLLDADWGEGWGHLVNVVACVELFVVSSERVKDMVDGYDQPSELGPPRPDMGPRSDMGRMARGLSDALVDARADAIADGGSVDAGDLVEGAVDRLEVEGSFWGFGLVVSWHLSEPFRYRDLGDILDVLEERISIAERRASRATEPRLLTMGLPREERGEGA